MRVTGRSLDPVTEVAYRRARPGGGTETARLPVDSLTVDAAPDGYDAVVVAGDLQGVAPFPVGGAPVLLGVALADYLPVWAGQGLLPPPDRVGVVLAGDLYSAPDADLRGASGDVADVWWALAAAGCRLVTGVAGNHDLITEDAVAERGNAVIGARLRTRPPPLTVCGHVHWERPLARLGTGHILNVDGRVVVLTS